MFATSSSDVDPSRNSAFAKDFPVPLMIAWLILLWVSSRSIDAGATEETGVQWETILIVWTSAAWLAGCASTSALAIRPAQAPCRKLCTTSGKR